MTIRVRLLSPQSGFSLIELAIVVLLASILLTMGIGAFSAQQASAAYSSTLRKQEYIKDALVSYLRSNRRLPCPETTGLPGAAPVTMLGREARSNGTPPDPAFPCSSYVGSLPWLDLGLAKDIALDGYGNFFTYYVASAAAAGDPDWTRTANPGVVTGFSVGSPGRFAITQNGIDTVADTSFNPLPALAVVVLVSHGKNGYGAITEKGTRNVDSANASELANQPPTVVELALAWSPQKAPYFALNMLAPAVTKTLIGSAVAGVAYDDIVLVLRPNDLLGPLIKDGALKSAEALIQEQLLTARDAAIALLLNGCIPPANVPNLPADPWGRPINYGNPAITTTLTATTPVAPATTRAFQIWSNGPNRADDSGLADDRILPTGLDVTFGHVRARIPATACP